MMFDRITAFAIGIPLLIVIEIIRWIKFKIDNRKFIYIREFLIILLSIYMMALVSVTLLPFNFYGSKSPEANLIPVFNTLKDISNIPQNMKVFMIKFWLVNIFGNLLLLIPLAVIVPLTFKGFRSFKATVLLGFMVALSIEVLQYLSAFLGNARSFDIDDIILNTLGAAIGFFFYKFIVKRVIQIKEEEVA
ncbi:VanZ family protein [Clostridium sp. C8-1-8]|uniref:VanZ family protein n=1 Tax=Clostridium sp. C8-1-8 TaxID=2698831 RepID=UPI001368B3F9|nr:VanZ family protein [Clostridium sp. C8-1-8]